MVLNLTITAIMSEYTVYCKWLPVNHWLFHLANVFLALSYIAPSNIPGLIYLRFVLGMAGACFSLWGWMILCAFDTMLWNAVFFVINFFLMFRLAFMIRPVQFEWYHEVLYKGLFEPAGVKRYDYRNMRNGSVFQHIMAGEKYSEEKVTGSDKIAVLLSGSINVSSKGKVLHQIQPFEFLDSPEWIMSQKKATVFQVTLEAIESSSYVFWKKKELESSLNKNLFLNSVFRMLVGQDLATKIFRGNQAVLDISEEERSTSPIVELYQGQYLQHCPGCRKDFEMTTL